MGSGSASATLRSLTAALLRARLPSARTVSDCRTATINVRNIRFVTEALPASCEVAIRLNNATNIHVGFADARFVESGLLAFDETANVDAGQAATQSGPVNGVYIDRFIGVKGSGNYRNLLDRHCCAAKSAEGL